MNKTQETFDILNYFICFKSTEQNISFLDDWAAEIIKSENYGFKNGLLGLGWLIGYLIQEEYILEDADEILADIDDILYKLTIREVLKSNIMSSNLLYYVTYYQQRLQFKSKVHFYRRFTHAECLKLLLDRLNKSLLDCVLVNRAVISEKMNILLKYSYLMKDSINENLVEESFYKSVEHLIFFFEKGDCLELYSEEIAKLYIVVCQYRNLHWEEKMKKLLTCASLNKHNQGLWVKLACSNAWRKKS